MKYVLYLTVGFNEPSSSSIINLLSICFDLFLHSITTTSIKYFFEKRFSLFEVLIACNQSESDSSKSTLEVVNRNRLLGSTGNNQRGTERTRETGVNLWKSYYLYCLLKDTFVCRKPTCFQINGPCGYQIAEQNK